LVFLEVYIVLLFEVLNHVGFTRNKVIVFPEFPLKDVVFRSGLPSEAINLVRLTVMRSDHGYSLGINIRRVKACSDLILLKPSVILLLDDSLQDGRFIDKLGSCIYI
jgi:hypothetical protein